MGRSREIIDMKRLGILQLDAGDDFGDPTRTAAGEGKLLKGSALASPHDPVKNFTDDQRRQRGICEKWLEPVLS
ncbi:hypothetical protein [Paenibacillus sp. PSB04]|uniref:hypothetical protein n=1 Tax=Paenibacillus sp. PSB04 TaxID=2866810 RepID=UPI0021F1F0C9|nr:hypothetical protein [Paenibacillus sp. PSB04]